MPRSYLPLLSAVVVAIITSCGGKGDGDDSLEAASQADSFATYYFNWRYVDAARFATTESLQTLSFVASNVSDSDIVALRQKPDAASVSIGEPEANSDSTLTIPIEVANYLKKDKIGEPPTLRRKGNFELQMVRRGGKWLVSLQHTLGE